MLGRTQARIMRTCPVPGAVPGVEDEWRLSNMGSSELCARVLGGVGPVGMGAQRGLSVEEAVSAETWPGRVW